tara:strand:+ start:526 stop:1038 length:513 start_codon:yes stop_codon:yes gene_type:complete
MSGVIKVDTIQKSNGATPTLADLSITATGTVVKVQRHNWDDATAYGNTPWTDVTGSSFSYTPILASSKLIITMSTHVKRDSVSNGSGISVRVLVDSTTLEFPNDIGYEHYHALGASGSTYWRYYKDHEYANSNTNAKTIKCQMRNYDSDSNTINESGNFVSSIIVYEVAN